MDNVFHIDYIDLCKRVDDEVVDLIIIDPPYLTTNEAWDKNEVVTENLAKELFRIAKPSCSLYCWCGIGEKSQSLIRWFPIFSKLWKFKDLITWKKQHGIGMRRGWLYTREEIMWFVKDNKRFIWNKKFQYSNEKRSWTPAGAKNLSIYKRFTNVWVDVLEIDMGMSLKQCKEVRRYCGHITPKPQKAIERIILAHTAENDIVFDCFVGSGTTAVAAKKLNRQFIVGDNDESFIEFTNERLKEV